MIKKYNLLNQKKLYRNLPQRSINKNKNKEKAMLFGENYFDGSREEGYGGYSYDGRWIKIAKRIISKWSLNNTDKFLDIGCAKGFLLYDLKNQMPDLNIFGIDISEYAKSKSHPSIRDCIITMNCCDNLPFKSNSFNCVVSINTIHNLALDDCKKAICEIERIAPGKGFIQVDAYRTEKERELFLNWMLTAKHYDTPDGWKKIFKECGYTGYYFWTILESD